MKLTYMNEEYTTIPGEPPYMSVSNDLDEPDEYGYWRTHVAIEVTNKHGAKFELQFPNCGYVENDDQLDDFDVYKELVECTEYPVAMWIEGIA